MSGHNEENKTKKDILNNNKFQNKNDTNNQHFLSYYKHYKLKEESISIIKQEEGASITSKVSQQLYLVEINNVFNKNQSFLGANTNESNPSPRNGPFLKSSISSSDSKEENSGNSDEASSSKKREDNSSDKSNDSENSSDSEEEEYEKSKKSNEQRTEILNNNKNCDINKLDYPGIITSGEIFKNLNNMNLKFNNSSVVGGNDTQKQEITNNNDFFNFSDYIQEKGWKISIDGHGWNQYFTTFELFEKLTNAIEQNTSLDSLRIFDKKNKKYFQGGGLYFALKIFLEKYFIVINFHLAKLRLLEQINQNNFHFEINNNYYQNQNNYAQYANEPINYFLNGQNTHDNNTNNFGVIG